VLDGDIVSPKKVGFLVDEPARGLVTGELPASGLGVFVFVDGGSCPIGLLIGNGSLGL
jgi:hypothetical protein